MLLYNYKGTDKFLYDQFVPAPKFAGAGRNGGLIWRIY